MRRPPLPDSHFLAFPNGVLDFAFEICPNGPHTHTHTLQRTTLCTPQGAASKRAQTRGLEVQNPVRGAPFSKDLDRVCRFVSFCVVLCRFVSLARPCLHPRPSPGPAWSCLLCVAFVSFCVVLCPRPGMAWPWPGQPWFGLFVVRRSEKSTNHKPARLPR